MIFFKRVAGVSLITFILLSFTVLFIITCNILSNSKLFNALQEKRVINPLEAQFRSTMTSSQKEDMLELLKTFKFQMEKYRITYFLYAGSLIGAHRHNGMIPWDDDIDIIIDSRQKEKLKESIGNLNKTHNLVAYEGKETSKWKFYKLDGHAIQGKPFRYPYLDLFFFKDHNETMFYVEKENQFMSKEDVFPLIDKNFNGLSMPTPCNTELILEAFYGDLNQCMSCSWNHSTEVYIPYSQQISVNCDLLRPFFPFTERTSEATDQYLIINEQQKIGSEILQSFQYKVPVFCSGNHSYYISAL